MKGIRSKQRPTGRNSDNKGCISGRERCGLGTKALLQRANRAMREIRALKRPLTTMLRVAMRLGFMLGLVVWACLEWRAVRYIVAIVTGVSVWSHW